MSRPISKYEVGGFKSLVSLLVDTKNYDRVRSKGFTLKNLPLQRVQAKILVVDELKDQLVGVFHGADEEAFDDMKVGDVISKGYSEREFKFLTDLLAVSLNPFDRHFVGSYPRYKT